MGHRRALLVLCIVTLSLRGCEADFWSTFQVTWGEQNINVNESSGAVEISLTADDTGATFASWNTYLFGSFKIQVKLVPGNSAGTVAAIFLSSAAAAGDDEHDEIDFEFLGNASGQPYKMQTNLFANGTGGREEQTYLWFDPTEDFHTYQVIWNHELIAWLVDDIPVRIYTNIEDVAPLSFPSFRPMSLTGCIFDGSGWATEGGGIPLNFTYAPFTVTFQDFSFEACVAEGDNVGTCASNYSGNWWEGAQYQTLSTDWANQMSWFRTYYLQYEYCKDITRYTTPPPECSYDKAI